MANQIQRIRDYAKMRGLDLLSRNIVIEEGVSCGIPLFERRAGKLLLAKIKTREFQHLICLKIDRMFRITSYAIHKFEELENT